MQSGPRAQGQLSSQHFAAKQVLTMVVSGSMFSLVKLHPAPQRHTHHHCTIPDLITVLSLE